MNDDREQKFWNGSSSWQWRFQLLQDRPLGEGPVKLQSIGDYQGEQTI